MKTIYKYNFISLTLFLLMSCNDNFLDKYPIDKINDQTYWQTPGDLRIYVNQFYESLFNNPYRMPTDNQSDNQGASTKNAYIWNEWTLPAAGKDGEWGKEDWSDIRNCNYFVQRYHSVMGDQKTINTYLGEILLFKSLFYFDKVKKFGDVPWLLTDLTTSSPELYAPRDKRDVVIDSINLCLDKAILMLPEISSEGRLTKYTAMAFKSRVNLYEGTFRKYHGKDNYKEYLELAADAAGKIINSGLFDLYTTGDPTNDYHSFFNLHSLADNPEAIFYTRYSTDTKMHNRSRQMKESGSGFTKDFVESFLCLDGLPVSLSDLYKGDEEFMDEFQNRDNRMKQTIYTPDRPLSINSEGEETYENSPVFSTLSYTGYRFYKCYSPYDADNEMVRCIIDDCHFRYAEVLLNYAEAMAELDACDQTVLNITINKLRRRVGMPDLVENPVSDPASIDYGYIISPLLYEIRRERRIELAVEGFRWDDIVRWKAGKLLENKNTYIGARDPETKTYKELYPGFTRVWNDKLYLRPIPTDELNYNPNLLPQNPGW